MPIIKPSRDASPVAAPPEPASDCAAFASQLTDPDECVRRGALRNVSGCADASSMLVERLNLEVDPSVRSLIFTALVSIADTSALQGLTDCLRSEDVALRNDAVQALTQLPSGAASFIQHLLRDDDPDVRILAVNVLESLRHPQVEAWLIDVVEHDSHLNVCATAVDLLGEVGSVAAREPLSSLKRRFPSDAYIQFAADLALQRIVDA